MEIEYPIYIGQPFRKCVSLKKIVHPFGYCVSRLKISKNTKQKDANFPNEYLKYPFKKCVSQQYFCPITPKNVPFVKKII